MPVGLRGRDPDGVRAEPKDRVRPVHCGGPAPEGDPQDAGGEEAGGDQEGPPRPHLLQVRHPLI